MNTPALTTASTSAAPNTSAASERRNAAGAENAGQQSANQQNAGQQNSVAPNATTQQPTATEPSGVEQGAQGTTPPNAPEQAPEATPAATPANEQQVAEAQPQTQIAPIANTNPAPMAATRMVEFLSGRLPPEVWDTKRIQSNLSTDGTGNTVSAGPRLSRSRGCWAARAQRLHSPWRMDVRAFPTRPAVAAPLGGGS